MTLGMKDMFDVLWDNGFEEPLADYSDYVVYNPSARGCHPEDPFIIDVIEGCVKMEYEIVRWIVEMARDKECEFHLLKQRFLSIAAKDGSQRHIDELVLSVDNQEETYYFDITTGFEALSH